MKIPCDAAEFFFICMQNRFQRLEVPSLFTPPEIYCLAPSLAVGALNALATYQEMEIIWTNIWCQRARRQLQKLCFAALPVGIHTRRSGWKLYSSAQLLGKCSKRELCCRRECFAPRRRRFRRTAATAAS
jgi:hypothetical protein